jgi:hypothetical protein
MASILDLDEDLRYLGRVIPPLSMATMEPVELRLRAAFAAQLIGLADLADDDSEARMLRRKARKILTALSLGQLSTQARDIDERISAAVRDSDEGLAEYLSDEQKRLLSDNPQVPAEYVTAAQVAALAARHKNPASRWRRFIQALRS